MLIARPCSSLSKAASNCRWVKYTATKNRPTASSSCETTTAAISRRAMECPGISGAQHISLSPQGEDQLGVTVFQLAAQSGDVNLNHVAEAFPVEVIEMLQQLGLRHHRSGAMRQVLQHTILHGGERHRRPAAAHRQVGS